MSLPSNHQQIETVVTYLEMVDSPRKLDDIQVSKDVSVKKVDAYTVSLCRFLYDAVGSKWNWTERKLLTNEQLEKIIKNPFLEVYVLYVKNSIAGDVELDFSIDAKIAYFGILPEFYGRKLGPYLLNWAVKYSWSKNPKRVWLHTCALDHPKALQIYLRSGFVQYKKKIEYIAKLP